MTTYLIVPEIDDLMDDALEIINGEMKKVFDQIENKVAAWFILEQKFGKTAASDRRMAAANKRYQALFDEIQFLYGSLVPKEDIIRTYESYFQRAYDEGGRSTEAEIDMPYYFDEPDLDFLREMSSQGRVTFANYFGSTGARLRNTIIQSIGKGHGWQRTKKQIQSVHGYSRDRADKIIRTELARATTEARLNQYDKTDRVVMVEWFAQRDDAHCSGNPIASTCAQAHGMHVKKEEAHGMQPAHVRCRCAWVPVTQTQAERALLEKEIMIQGSPVDTKGVQAAIDEILTLPDSIRKHVMKDVESGQLKIVFASPGKFYEGYGKGYKTTTMGYWENNIIHGSDSYTAFGGHDRLGSRHGPNGYGIDFVVIKGTRWSAEEMARTATHEIMHHVDLSLIPRLKGTYPSRRNAMTNAPTWKAGYRRQDAMNQWKRWVREYGVKNEREFWTETMGQVIRNPLSMRNTVKDCDERVWAFIRKQLKFLDKKEV